MILVVDSAGTTTCAARRLGKDAALVVEVADTTVALDLGRKAAAYAAGGVAVYWVVSLPDQLVVVHTAPRRQRSAPKGWAWGSIERVERGRLTAPACKRAVALATFMRDCG